MRTKKKKRLRPQTKSGHVRFCPTAVADCSHNAEYGERDGDLQGALDSPPGGGGATDWVYGPWRPGLRCLFSFPNITRCVAPVRVRGDVPLSEKCGRTKQPRSNFFFFPFYFFFSSMPKSVHVRHTCCLFMKSLSARVKHFQVQIEQSSTLFF